MTSPITIVAPEPQYPDLLMFVKLSASGHEPTDVHEVWVPVTEEQVQSGTVPPLDGPRSATRVFTLRKGLRLVKPGAVFRVRLSESAVNYARGSMPVAAFQNAAVVAEWRAISNAVEAAAKSAKATEKRVREIGADALEPFRAAYGRLNHAQRPQLIAEVVRYITRGH